MSLDQVLGMKVRQFHWLFSQIPRIKAEDDLRFYQIAATAQGAKEGEKIIERLQDDLGVILEFDRFIPKKVELEVTEEGLDPEFDRAGLQRLRAMMR